MILSITGADADSNHRPTDDEALPDLLRWTGSGYEDQPKLKSTTACRLPSTPTSWNGKACLLDEPHSYGTYMGMRSLIHWMNPKGSGIPRPYGRSIGIPEQNAIVDAVSWISGDCRLICATSNRRGQHGNTQTSDGRRQRGCIACGAGSIPSAGLCDGDGQGQFRGNPYRGGVAADLDARSISRAARGGHGTGIQQPAAAREPQGNLRMRRMPTGAFQVRVEVRQPRGLARLLDDDAGRARQDGGRQRKPDPHRTPLPPLRQPYRASLRRRSAAHRAALLHGRSGLDVRAGLTTQFFHPFRQPEKIHETHPVRRHSRS